ncbi:MAG: L-seryl-tRNA(Sec) selenium transferase [delta proteobacterium ML8_F1]|nr:MAG: L-seryl-tRNA(Sec) selenium transferase [delta proteobacterium ML8_F1]
MDKSALRNLPKVDDVMNHSAFKALAQRTSKAMVLSEVKKGIQTQRERILKGEPPLEDILGFLYQEVEKITMQAMSYALRPVINATGIIIHTNLGRSVLVEEAGEVLDSVNFQYSNLEFDLDTGKRGLRYSHVEDILMRLTGAEGALVVNNNAAAVMLILSTVARDQEVLVSRGELVEIGGSFRVPEVMAMSGATLVEVGTTNKTHLKDYAREINPKTGAILKVHTSNYRVMGFTQSVPVEELVALGETHDIPVIEDLGSGTLLDLTPYGLSREPTVQEQVAKGVDLISFSGDKLLGGPQAGIIVGTRRYIDRVKSNQLLRALRVDKMTIAALEATLRQYIDMEKAKKKVPTLRMITMPLEEIKARALRIHEKILLGDRVAVVEDTSQIGGGTYPLDTLPTWALEVTPLKGAQSFADGLRGLQPPIIARIREDKVYLDCRTIFDQDIDAVARGINHVLEV